MYLARFLVKGFRSIKEAEVHFAPGLNAIIGLNNSGKSNLLRAIDCLLGEKYPTYSDIEANDFFEHQGQRGHEILLVAELRGQDIDSARIAKSNGLWRALLNNNPFDGSELTINSLDLREVFQGSDDFGRDQRRYLRGQELELVAETLQEARGCYFALRVSADPRDEGEFLRELRFFYQDRDRDWFVCWNISKDLREAFLTSTVLPSFREPGGQLRSSQWTWYGKLLHQMLDERASNSLSSALGALNEAAKPLLSQVNAVLAEQLQKSFGDSTVRLQLVGTDQEDLARQVQLYASDGVESNLGRKGTGLQSATIMTLFAEYSRRFHPQGSLLALEEPELYLHPQGQRAIAAQLQHFAEQRRNQVIVSSHSPVLLAAMQPNTIVRLAKTNGASRSYTLSHADVGPFSDLLFGERLVICLNASQYLLPLLAPGTFGPDTLFVRLNPALLAEATAALEVLGLPYHIVADLGSLLAEVAPLAEAVDSKRQRNLVRNLQELLGRRSRNSRLTREQINDRALLHELDRWRETLAAQAKLWLLARGGLQDYLQETPLAEALMGSGWNESRLRQMLGQYPAQTLFDSDELQAIAAWIGASASQPGGATPTTTANSATALAEAEVDPFDDLPF
jgi:putative ATP-dependent endonuclease of the OLD family